MKNPPWGNDTAWTSANKKEAEKITVQARRYCPQLDRSLVAVSEKPVTFYEDYKLVFLASDTNETSTLRQEVFGFYAPGDFRPLDGAGHTIEALNKMAPLHLMPDNVLDYALLRMRFEIGARIMHKQQGDALQPTDSFVRAEIPTKLDDLPFDKTGEQAARIASLLETPQLENLQTTNAASPQTDSASAYRVAASVAFPVNKSYQLVNVSVDLTSAGELLWDTLLERSERVSVSIGIPSAKTLVPFRTRTAMPIWQWYEVADELTCDSLPQRLCQKLGTNGKAWHRLLNQKYRFGSDTSGLTLRIADLPFYRTFCLLEVLEQISPRAESSLDQAPMNNCRRSYAFVRRHEDSLDVRPLDGSSSVIHKINADDDRPMLEGDNCDEYLRFFCWTISSPQGAFCIPREIREIPFVSVNQEQLQEIRKRYTDGEFHIRAVADDEVRQHKYPDGAGARRKALVSWGKALFEAWFNIESTGLVQMFDDNPLIRLEMENERFGNGDLMVLKLIEEAGPAGPTETIARPQLHHYLQDVSIAGSAKAPATSLREENTSPKSRENMSGQNRFWRELLKTGGKSEKRVWFENVTFDDLCLSEEQCFDNGVEVFIRNWVFNEEVRLVNLSNAPTIIFVGCEFNKGIDASEAVVSKSLRFIDCSVRPIAKQSSTVAVNFENAHLAGELLFYDCRIGGRFFAPSLQAKSSVRLRGCRLAPSLDDIGDRVHFNEIGVDDIEGLLKRVGWACRDQIALSAVSFENANVGGDLEITAAVSERELTATWAQALTSFGITLPDAAGTLKRVYEVIGFGALNKLIDPSSDTITKGIEEILNDVQMGDDRLVKLLSEVIDKLSSRPTGRSVAAVYVQHLEQIARWLNEKIVTRIRARTRRSISQEKGPAEIKANINSAAETLRTTLLMAVEVWVEMVNGAILQELFSPAASVIDGSINGRGANVHGQLVLSGALCLGTVSFENSFCHQDVTLSAAQIEYLLRFSHFRALGTLTFDNATINGNLIGAKSMTGSLSLFSVNIQGSLDLSESRMRSSVNCYRATIGGAVKCEKSTMDSLILSNSHINGHLSLRQTHVRADLSLSSATFLSQVDILGLKIDGDLKCVFASMGSLWAYPVAEITRDSSGQPQVTLSSDAGLQIAGDLDLSGADIGYVELRGVTVKGIIKIKTGKLGALLLAPGLSPDLDNEKKFALRPCRAGALRMEAVEILEDVDVSGLRTRVPHGWDTRVRDTVEEGIKIAESKIGQSLVLFTSNLKRKLEIRIGWPKKKREFILGTSLIKPGPPDFPWAESDSRKYGTECWGGLSLPANHIGGELDLRGVSVKGPIYLNNSTIGINLKIGLKSDELDEDDFVGRSTSRVTTCLHLDAEKLRCGGDVDFSGLRIWQQLTFDSNECPTKLEKKYFGSLRAQGAHVNGQIRFLAPVRHQEAEIAGRRRALQRTQDELKKLEERSKDDKDLVFEKKKWQRFQKQCEISNQPLDVCHQDDDAVPSALIDGGPSCENGTPNDHPYIDLTGVHANHLLISGSNAPHLQAAISLERAEFGRLEIVDPAPDPINLSRVSVGRWVFGNEYEPDNASDYIKVLKKMKPFDRSVWITVETALRNQMLEDEAHKVYRTMRWEARRLRKTSTNALTVPERFRRGMQQDGWGVKEKRPLKSAISIPVVLCLSLVAVATYLCWPAINPLIIGLALVMIAALVVRSFDWDWLYGMVLGFGTRASWPMFLSLVLLFPLSLTIFSHAKNVRTSTELALWEKLDDADSQSNSTGQTPNAAQKIAEERNHRHLEIHPDDRRLGYPWTFGDDLALTVRYQVPIIPLLTHSRWEASEDRIGDENRFVNSIPGLREVRAEHYAEFLVIYHSIAWPLFLIWLASLVVRGRKA